MKSYCFALIFVFNLFFFSSKSQNHFHYCNIPSNSLNAMQTCVNQAGNNFGYFVADLYPLSSNSYGLKLSAFDKNGFPIPLNAPIKDLHKSEDLKEYIPGRFFISLDFYNTIIKGNSSIYLIPEDFDEDYDGGSRTFVHYRISNSLSSHPTFDAFLNPSPPKPSNLKY